MTCTGNEVRSFSNRQRPVNVGIVSCTKAHGKTAAMRYILLVQFIGIQKAAAAASFRGQRERHFELKGGVFLRGAIGGVRFDKHCPVHIRNYRYLLGGWKRESGQRGWRRRCEFRGRCMRWASGGLYRRTDRLVTNRTAYTRHCSTYAAMQLDSVAVSAPSKAGRMENRSGECDDDMRMRDGRRILQGRVTITSGKSWKKPKQINPHSKRGAVFVSAAGFASHSDAFLGDGGIEIWSVTLRGRHETSTPAARADACGRRCMAHCLAHCQQQQHHPHRSGRMEHWNQRAGVDEV